MTTRFQTVKVSRVSLLLTIKKKLAEAKTAHAQALAEYEAALALWKQEERKRADEVYAAIVAGEFKASRYSGEQYISYFQDGAYSPDPPTDPTPAIERDIKLLELAADDTLPVSADSNWLKYL